MPTLVDTLGQADKFSFLVRKLGFPRWIKPRSDACQYSSTSATFANDDAILEAQAVHFLDKGQRLEAFAGEDHQLERVAPPDSADGIEQQVNVTDRTGICRRMSTSLLTPQLFGPGLPHGFYGAWHSAEKIVDDIDRPIDAEYLERLILQKCRYRGDDVQKRSAHGGWRGYNPRSWPSSVVSVPCRVVIIFGRRAGASIERAKMAAVACGTA